MNEENGQKMGIKQEKYDNAMILVILFIVMSVGILGWILTSLFTGKPLYQKTNAYEYTIPAEVTREDLDFIIVTTDQKED